MVIWLVCTFVNAISASLITTFVYGGATGVNGTSVLTATLVVAMKDILASVISSSLIEKPPRQGHHCRHRVGDRAEDSPSLSQPGMRPTPWRSDNDALSVDDEEEDE